METKNFEINAMEVKDFSRFDYLNIETGKFFEIHELLPIAAICIEAKNFDEVKHLEQPILESFMKDELSKTKKEVVVYWKKNSKK